MELDKEQPLWASASDTLTSSLHIPDSDVLDAH